MLAELRAQLHFVRRIQAVDTTGVEPLRRIADETDTSTIGLEALRGALEREVVVGRWHKRIRRVEEPPDERSRAAEEWDVLGQAPKRAGRFFVVEGGEG